MFRSFLPSHRPSQILALSLAATLAFPIVALSAGCGNKGTDTSAPSTSAPIASVPPSGPSPSTMGTQPAPAKPGMSRAKKTMIVLAGAALLYYLYKKHQAAQAAQAPQGGSAAGGAQPQLYREEKGPNTGAIYYRDPQTHVPVWVTAPSQPISVPADQVQQYAPDYQQYNGPAPTVPSGARTVGAAQYDPSLSQG